MRPRRSPESIAANGDISIAGSPVEQGGAGQSIQDGRPNSIWAIITGHVSANKYAFARVDEGDSPDFDELEDAPEVGDGVQIAAFEINGRADVPADGGIRVRLWPAGDSEKPYYTFALGGSASSDAATSSAWLADLADTDCLRMTIVGTPGGACSGVTSSQEIPLAFSEANLRWESEADAFASTGTSSTATVTFTPGTPTPTASIGDTQGVYLGASGGGVLFAFAGAELCGGTRGVCNNGFVASFKCECCRIAGWHGPGWYCVREAGTEDECEAQELLDEDKCDHTIEICSGPYGNEADAVAVCAFTPPTVADSCEGLFVVDTVPIPLGTVYSGVFGPQTPGSSCTLPWFRVSVIPGHQYRFTGVSGIGDGVLPCLGGFTMYDVNSLETEPCGDKVLLGEVYNFTPLTAEFTALHDDIAIIGVGVEGYAYSFKIEDIT